VKVSINPIAIESMKKAFGNLTANIPKELAIAINLTAKQAKIQAARALKKELNVPVKVLKKAISTRSKATAKKTKAIVGLYAGYPIPLMYFKPRQTKSGIVAKINSRLKTKATLPNAFISQKYRGGVFQRVGKARSPIKTQYGPSPGSAFENAGVKDLAVAVAQTTLPKEIKRRIRFLTLKANDGLRGKQK
jgi:hypothetical protein